jgi:hypothetical protein
MIRARIWTAIFLIMLSAAAVCLLSTNTKHAMASCTAVHSHDYCERAILLGD